jgi:hypothetical protein
VTEGDHSFPAQAAKLQAEARAGAAAHVLRRILELEPGNPRAHFALGQVRGPTFCGDLPFLAPWDVAVRARSPGYQLDHCCDRQCAVSSAGRR